MKIFLFEIFLLVKVSSCKNISNLKQCEFKVNLFDLQISFIRMLNMRLSNTSACTVIHEKFTLFVNIQFL